MSKNYCMDCLKHFPNGMVHDCKQFGCVCQTPDCQCEMCQKGNCNKDIYENGMCYMCFKDTELSQ